MKKHDLGCRYYLRPVGPGRSEPVFYFDHPAELANAPEGRWVLCRQYRAFSDSIDVEIDHGAGTITRLTSLDDRWQYWGRLIWLEFLMDVAGEQPSESVVF